MHKNIKKLIAGVLTIGAVTGTVPLNYGNSMVTAYAAEKDDEDEISAQESIGDPNEETPDSIKVKSGSSTLRVYSSRNYKRDEIVEPSEIAESPGDTFYIKTDKDSIKFDVSGVSNSRAIKLFEGTGSKIKSSAKAKSVKSAVTLNEDKTIVIRVYDKLQPSALKYSDDDDVKAEYTFKVKYTGADKDLDDSEDSADINNGSSSSKGDPVYLENLTLSEGKIKFDKKTDSYNVTVDSDTEEIEITAEPEDEDTEVRIDGRSVDEDDDWSKSVYLQKGLNKIEIRLKDEDDRERTYVLNITRGKIHSMDAEATTSENLLSYLSLGSTELKVSDGTTIFKRKYKEGVEKVTVTAQPKDDDYTVIIDGIEVDADDDYKKTVYLEDGKVKEFKVIVEKSSSKRQVYKLYLGAGVDSSAFPGTNSGNNNGNNGSSSGSNSGNNNGNNGSSSGSNNNINNNYPATTPVQRNKWQKTADGLWIYYDSNGNILRDTWFYDPGYKQTYYFDTTGIMKTGWTNIRGKWYYMDNSGARKTGWIQSDGKWFFLDSTGVMMSNCSINGYWLTASGAWDGRK